MNIVPILVTIIIDVILCIIVGAIAARDKNRNGIAWFFASLFVTPLFASLFLIVITLQDNYPSARGSTSVPAKVVSTDSDTVSGNSPRTVYFLKDGTGKWECPDCGAINAPSTMDCKCGFSRKS